MTLRVGMCGTGLIGRFHARMLASAQTPWRWAGVYDPDSERARAFATDHGAPLMDSEEEVMAACDALYVCTWTSEHPRLVAEAARRGRAVFCEKPLGVDLATASEMTAVVEAAGVVNQVGLVLRYAPPYLLVRDLVADPGAGRVMSVVFRDDQYIPIQGHYASTWRADRDRAGAGTLMEHSIHDLDLLEFMVGPVASLSAVAANFHGHDGIEDSVAAALLFADGAVGSLASVWHDVLERPSLRRIEIFCENTWIEAGGSDLEGPVRWRRTGEEERSVEGAGLFAECERRGLVLDNPDDAFLRAATGGGTAWPGFRHALRAHELCDAVYRSAAEGGAAVPCTP